MSSQLTDAFARKFYYLRLSVTDVCNFRCTYCLPDGYRPASHEAKRFLSLDEIRRVSRAFAALGTEKVRLTGGEPTLRRDFCDIIAAVRENPGIKTLADLRGYLKSLFSDGLVEELLPVDGTQYVELDGALYTIDGGRGADITKGEETVQVLRDGTPGRCTVRVTVEVLDPQQGFSVVGSETHDFLYEQVGERWIFTDLFNGAIRDRRKSHTGCAMIAVYQILVYCVFLCSTGGQAMAVTCTGEGPGAPGRQQRRGGPPPGEGQHGELSRQIDLELPRSLTLDLEGVTFMDSSGIAVLLRAYRRLGELGGAVKVVHVPAQAGKVLRAAGLDKLMEFE